MAGDNITGAPPAGNEGAGAASDVSVDVQLVEAPKGGKSGRFAVYDRLLRKYVGAVVDKKSDAKTPDKADGDPADRFAIVEV